MRSKTCANIKLGQELLEAGFIAGQVAGRDWPGFLRHGTEQIRNSQVEYSKNEVNEGNKREEVRLEADRSNGKSPYHPKRISGESRGSLSFLAFDRRLSTT